MQGLELEALVAQAASDDIGPLENVLCKYFCGLRVINTHTKVEDLPKRGTLDAYKRNNTFTNHCQECEFT